MNASNLFNADETLMTVAPNGDIRFLKMTDAVRRAHHSKKMRLNTVGSMTPFVNAAGEVVLIVYCLKAPEGKITTFNVDVIKESTCDMKVISFLLSSRFYCSYFSLFLVAERRQDRNPLLLFRKRLYYEANLAQSPREVC